MKCKLVQLAALSVAVWAVAAAPALGSIDPANVDYLYSITSDYANGLSMQMIKDYNPPIGPPQLLQDWWNTPVVTSVVVTNITVTLPSNANSLWIDMTWDTALGAYPADCSVASSLWNITASNGGAVARPT